MSELVTATKNHDLDLVDQKYSKDPRQDREADQYRNEYTMSFVEKWDSLIDWDARAKSEGDFFVNVLRSRHKKSVLDVATGTGFHSVNLLESGFDVTSADGSATMLAQAFENAKDRGHILKTVQADWRWLGQATRERFDAIVCLGNSFTHLHDELDRRRSLAEFYAALEPNGMLIIDQRNYDFMLDKGFKSKHKYYYCGDQVSAKPIHIDEELIRFKYTFADKSEYTLNLHPLRRNYFRRLLREAGFERIRTYGDFQAAYNKDDSDFLVHVAEKSTRSPMVSVARNISSRARAVSEDYYNSDDADAFYSTIWGGEDLHLGIYENTRDIKEAGFATVDLMASQLPELDKSTKVLDLGSGYGGSARRLASRFGCSVTGLNLSETQNDRAMHMNTNAGLAEQIEIVHGSFEDIPAANESIDVVWSQDSFLHSGARDLVLAESFRVLKPGGRLLFTDPMQAANCSKTALNAIYARIFLSSLGSYDYYSSTCELIGFNTVDIIDLSPQLAEHYARVREELINNRELVEEGASSEYIERMTDGLGHWIEGGKTGELQWGVMHFQKPV